MRQGAEDEKFTSSKLFLIYKAISIPSTFDSQGSGELNMLYKITLNMHIHSAILANFVLDLFPCHFGRDCFDPLASNILIPKRVYVFVYASNPQKQSRRYC